MDLDVETAGAPEGTRRFRRWLGALVGVTALAVALLTALESDAGRGAERALVRASRLSTEIFGRIAASAPPRTFAATSAQQVLAIGTTARARIVAAFEERGSVEASEALSAVDRRIEARLADIVKEMTAPPDPGGPLDETTRVGMTTSIAQLRELVTEQNAAVDAAEQFGRRQERAMLALVLAAVAAVLLGVAGVTGEGRGGAMALVLAGAALAGAVGWGVTGLLV